MKRAIVAAVVTVALFGAHVAAAPRAARYEKAGGPRWFPPTVLFKRCDNIADLTRARFYLATLDVVVFRCPRGKP